MQEREGLMQWREHETWYRVVGELDPDSPQTPVVICHGGPGAAHDYCEPIAELSRYGRACVLYDQVGCGKSQHLPDAPAEFWTPQLFKDELVELTDAARHRRPACRRRAVLGRDARDGVRARPPARPTRDRRRRLAREHDSLGLGGEPPAGGSAGGRTGDADPSRAGGNDRRSRVRRGGAGLLRRASVPRAVAGLRAAQLRPDGRRPDRLPHDERTERVPRRRLPQDVGHHRPAARDHDPDAARLGPPRRGDAADRRADPRADRRLAVGRCSRSRATCRTSRSRRPSSSGSRSSCARSTTVRAVSRARRAARRP